MRMPPGNLERCLIYSSHVSTSSFFAESQKRGRTYDGDSLEVIPIEDALELQAGSSVARMPQPVTPSTSSSSKVGSYHTGIAWSQTQSFALPSNQRAVQPRTILPSEEIIECTADSPNAPVNIPLGMQPRFFRSGVLKIMPTSSLKTPPTMDVTSAAESSVLREINVSDDDVSLRELISRESNLTTRPREDGSRTLASSQTPRNGPSETILPFTALVLGSRSSRMPLDTHDKPRCVLIADWISSLFTVSMRGIVESLDISSLEFGRNLHKPAAPAQESVDDACLLHAGDTSIVILAHAREEKQISYLKFQNCKVCFRGYSSRSFKPV